MTRRSVDQWRRMILRTPRINDATRVLMLVLAEHMRTNRQVSVPRATLAKQLGRSERRITDRIAAAHAAGVLSTVSKGYRGTTATYQGLFPTAESGTHGRPLSQPESGTPTSPLSSAESVPHTQMGSRSNPRKSGTHGGPTNIGADLSASGTDRHVGSYDEHRDTPAAYGLTACDCHGATDCAALTDREESA